MSEEKTVTCINCPIGCRVTVRFEDGEIVSVEGNTCKRGDTYARQECVEPKRMVTAVLPVESGETPASVRTVSPVPKALIKDVMRELSQLTLKAPVSLGEVVCADVCGTGVDVIATCEVRGTSQ
jgi:CxxC motif-containing protein